MNKYPNSGRLNYSRNKINPNSADLYGDITFDRAYLKQLLEENDGDDIVVKLSAWQKEGNYGTWFSVRVNTYKPDQQAAPRPQAKPAAPIDNSDVPF